MQFYTPEYFMFLWSIPALIGIFWLVQRAWKRRIAKIGNQDLVLTKLMPNYDPTATFKKFFFLVLALIFSTIALARPQWGEEKKKIQRKGIDVIFMLDTSLSMLAEDIKPSRLEKSKLEIKSILRQLKGDRVGMIAFAGSGFLQSPLTLDYSAFLLFVDAIQTGYIPDPGTSLAQALMLGVKSFPKENLKHKAIILFTDGEDMEGGVESALEEVVKSGIRVYPVGTGLEKGDPIPLKNEQGQRSGFKKDRSGQIVITKLNSGILEKIAKDTGGIYLPSTPGEQEIPVILRHMDSLGKKQFKENEITEREDHYQFFLFLGFLMLCLEMMVREIRKNGKKKRSDLLAGSMPMMLVLIWLFHSGFLETSKSLNNKANDEFKEKKYQSAETRYRKAQVKNPDDPTIRYNLGSTLYQTQNYIQAAKELEKSLEHSKHDKELQARALYNYGNTQYRLGNFEKAIESYQKALDVNPDDKDAKYNLEFLQNKKNAFDKKDQEQKKQDQNKQQKNQPKPQNQKQQQQQEQQQQPEQQQNQQQQNQDQQQEQEQQQQNEQESTDQKDSQSEQENQPRPDPGSEQDQQQKEDQKQEESQGQEREQNQDQKDGQDDQEQQQQDQEEEDQEQMEPKEDSGEEQKPSQGSSKPLQGQMSINDALRILEAMKDSEKDLQDLRKPPTPDRPRIVEKDW